MQRLTVVNARVHTLHSLVQCVSVRNVLCVSSNDVVATMNDSLYLISDGGFYSQLHS